MSRQPERRQEISLLYLKAIVEQFLDRKAHSISDINQFAELAQGLIKTIDLGAALPILDLLRDHPDTPVKIKDLLITRNSYYKTSDDYSLARRISQYVDSEKNSHYMDRATNKTFADLESLRELAADLTVRIDPVLASLLMDTARDDHYLARILLDRDDPIIDQKTLFLAANRLERQAIINEAQRRFKDVKTGIPIFNEKFISEVKRLSLSQNLQEIFDIFSSFLCCRLDRLKRLIFDINGEPLIFLLIIVGITPKEVMRIVVLMHPILQENSWHRGELDRLVSETSEAVAIELLTGMLGGFPKLIAYPSSSTVRLLDLSA